MNPSSFFLQIMPSVQCFTKRLLQEKITTKEAEEQ